MGKLLKVISGGYLNPKWRLCPVDMCLILPCSGGDDSVQDESVGGRERPMTFGSVCKNIPVWLQLDSHTRSCDVLLLQHTLLCRNGPRLPRAPQESTEALHPFLGIKWRGPACFCSFLQPRCNHTHPWNTSSFYKQRQ